MPSKMVTKKIRPKRHARPPEAADPAGPPLVPANDDAVSADFDLLGAVIKPSS